MAIYEPRPEIEGVNPMITKEEREVWRKTYGVNSAYFSKRITHLLDALDEAEAKMYEMDLHTGGARVVQCKSCQEAEARAEKAERERNELGVAK